VQGALVGYIRANPILVSIAGLSLVIGGAALATGGQRIYPGGEGLQMFKGRVAGIPVEALYFFATVIVGQFVLSWTRIGREMIMAGSNLRAAIAAGIDTAKAVTIAYVIAGACSAVAGVLLAARYGSGDMELGAGYDYTAIAAVLVGGTAIQGGSGSVVRTLIGVTVIAIIEVVLLLRGFSQQLQYLITGLIVLAVIMLHTIGERR
jgi:ribose/xylose/arabinose/galactoside ABC-type transport system permease subunit